MPERLILRNFQSAGDILMLTATVRDLHRCYPGRFVTDVRTSCSDLWITTPAHAAARRRAGRARGRLPVPDHPQSNQAPWHFLFGFSEHLNDELGLRIQPTEYRGDVHLTPEERDGSRASRRSAARRRRTGSSPRGGSATTRSSGGTPARYQQVVDHFRGRIDFVQVGETHHHHPAARGVTDLRGHTTSGSWCG